MADHLRPRHRWIFCGAALAVWLALGWPVLQALIAGAAIRDAPVSVLWLVPFTLFGVAVVGAMVLKLPGSLRWALLCVQVAAVVAMAIVVNWAIMSMFLIIVAWQAAMATAPFKALSWVVTQWLVVIATLGLVPNPDLCWVIWMSAGLQLCVLFTANALRREAQTAQALTQAQAVIANTIRDAERLRIARELHDAWGHELTALGLQLEIASHVSDPARARDHVTKAKGLAGDLLTKVRDVVSTLRDDDRCDLKAALEALAQRVPTPTIHVDIPGGLQVSPDHAHALMRCAQEAVTNAVRHAQASNLWLQVTSDDDGVRLVARDDGSARPSASAPGSGLVGMRERVECLGGRLAVQAGGGPGFTITAWLPSGAPKAA